MSGRLLARNRIDHGTRESLVCRALDFLGERGAHGAVLGPSAAGGPSAVTYASNNAAPPSPAAVVYASNNAAPPDPLADAEEEARGERRAAERRLLPLLLIELGFCRNNASRYVESGHAYVVALRHLIGRSGADRLLREAGVELEEGPGSEQGGGEIGLAFPVPPSRQTSSDGPSGALAPDGPSGVSVPVPVPVEARPEAAAASSHRSELRLSSDFPPLGAPSTPEPAKARHKGWGPPQAATCNESDLSAAAANGGAAAPAAEPAAAQEIEVEPRPHTLRKFQYINV